MRSDVDELQVLSATFVLKPSLAGRYKAIHAALMQVNDFELVLIKEFCPVGSKPWQRYIYKKELVVPTKAVLYTYIRKKEHLSFLWKVPIGISESDLLQRNVSAQQRIKEQLPKFHTRSMCREFVSSFGRASHANPAFLREAYRRLSGDSSCYDTTAQEEVAKRIARLLDAEDPYLVWDLRTQNEGRPETLQRLP